ncbi:MAG: hypothetical protein ACPG5B_02030 [Chitinophagales bacterium]
MKLQTLFLVVLFPFLLSNVHAQTTDDMERKHFIGSTLFMALTPLLNPSPNYYQLNYGYRITPKDVLSVEAITWSYYGPQKKPNSEAFPGKVQAFGLGLAYKRFLWKGIYSQIHSTAFRQNYIGEDDKKIQSGFQLFNVLRFGYHIKLFKNRWFIEPSVAATSWFINTNLPDSFQVEEDKWDNYLLFEPGLHVGFNF